MPLLDEAHIGLMEPKESANRVAILLAGVGSSSAESHLSTMASVIQDCSDSVGFDVCQFSYRGLHSDRYEPRDTVNTDLTTLVDYLDRYIKFYQRAEHIVLIGHSLGGIIASEWIFRNNGRRKAGKGLSASRVSGLYLVSSPVQLKLERVDFENPRPAHQFGRDQLTKNILTQYTADPDRLHQLCDTVVLRCEVDGLLHDDAYRFPNANSSNGPTELLPFAGVDHGEIPSDEELHTTIVELLQRV